MSTFLGDPPPAGRRWDGRFFLWGNINVSFIPGDGSGGKGWEELREFAAEGRGISRASGGGRGWGKGVTRGLGWRISHVV